MSAVGDNPISSNSEDLLGRWQIAQALARDIRRADSSEGYVFGVVGPWGSGKTSLLNLVKHELAAKPESTVVAFNPWMFAGTEQLVEAFFHELSAQLRETNDARFKKIASTVDTYANLFSPISLIPWVGAWYDRFMKITKAAKQYSDDKRPSVSAKRGELTEMMKHLKEPIVVTVDDIDRLSSTEIRDLFKLVRLTGNFPNLIYVLAFDRKRVEQALSETGIDGRVYLEKIVQHNIRLPELSLTELSTVLMKALDTEIEDLPQFPYFNADRWMDIYAEIVLPLIRNIRDIRRYVASFGSTVRDLGQTVDVADLLALEAVKVFLPDRFDRLVVAREGLTTNVRQRDARLEAQVISVLEGLQDDARTTDILKALINRVFPFGSRHIGGGMYADDFQANWFRLRRLAHTDVFGLYIERQQPQSLISLRDAEQAFALLTPESSEAELEAFLRALNADRIEGVVDALTYFESDFDISMVTKAVRVLLNVLADTPERERVAFFDFGPEATFRATIWRFLKLIDDANLAGDIVDEILAKTSSLSSKFLLIRMVGHREGTGHQVVTIEHAAALESKISAEIAEATAQTLAEEWDILSLLSTPTYWGLRESPVITSFENEKLHRAILLKARTESRQNMLGDRAVRTRTELYWDSLVRIYGDDDAIRRAAECAARTAQDANDPVNDLVALVEKYLSGWRPRER